MIVSVHVHVCAHAHVCIIIYNVCACVYVLYIIIFELKYRHVTCFIKEVWRPHLNVYTTLVHLEIIVTCRLSYSVRNITLPFLPPPPPQSTPSSFQAITSVLIDKNLIVV